MLLCEPPPQVYYIESNYNYQFSGILLSIFRSGFGARLSPHPYEAHSKRGREGGTSSDWTWRVSRCSEQDWSKWSKWLNFDSSGDFQLHFCDGQLFFLIARCCKGFDLNRKLLQHIQVTTRRGTRVMRRFKEFRLPTITYNTIKFRSSNPSSEYIVVYGVTNKWSTKKHSELLYYSIHTGLNYYVNIKIQY